MREVDVETLAQVGSLSRTPFKLAALRKRFQSQSKLIWDLAAVACSFMAVGFVVEAAGNECSSRSQLFHGGWHPSQLARVA